MRPRFKVFLSAVTSECGEARKLVASDLRSRGLEVRVQEDFRQEPGSDTTLGKLHNYVRDCDAVVAIIGERSGSFPPADAAEPFKAMLPQGFDRVDDAMGSAVRAALSQADVDLCLLGQIRRRRRGERGRRSRLATKAA